MNQAVVCSWAVRAGLVLVCLTLAIPAASGQVISEFLAHNNGLLLDQDGESPDWIEIHNPASQPISLLNWSLTDSATNLTKWRFPDVTVAPDSYLVVFASGKDIRNVGEPLHTNFKLDDAGEDLALVAADGVTVVSSFQPAYPLQVPNISFGLQDVVSSSALLAATAPARVLIPANDALGTNWTAQAFDDSTWLQGANGVGYETSPAEYASLIRTDVGPAMTQNSSCYVRLPFRVDDPAAFSQWRLLVQYDDGFIAYLNGHEVARRNAPDNAAWNSAATANHPDAEAVVPEEFSLTPVADWIVRGTNVLALQGLNTGTSSSDFLILATVEARPLSGGGAGLAYFTSPTPGAPNAGGVQALGPLIESATHSPLAPGAGDELSVAAKVLPTFHPVREVLLHYRVMFEPEVIVSMFDDGQHRDGAAGDGVFVGAIPAGAAAPAQMIRYFISATDDIGNATRLPLFPDPRDSAEYLGTVVSDPGIESRLPVVHWFAQTPSQADTPTGTRSSVYYGGEFYDNVLFSLHGQSSSGFPKRGYNVDFARDHRFRYAPDNARVKDIKLLTNWADKSRVRNALAYEFIRESGSVGHFAFQVRVQRNGQFHAILDLMEDADDRWMERIGRDPDGALYKMYNSLDSAGGNEKKTRRSEDFSDLQSLVNNLSPSRSLSNRVVYAYDNLDLPQTISYFVALALISSQDHGHKNYFLYRDSNASQEWAIFPWDVDLSWGRNWIDSGGYFTDTLYQNNVLSFYNSAQQNKPSNRLYDLISGHPDFRRMYLRRLRTVMDTLLQPTGLPSGELKIEARIRQMMDLMDPPDVSQSDADLDFAKWGSWGNRNPMRQEAQRILDIHLPGRRGFLFTNSTAMLKGDPIPPSQATNAVALFGAIDANPASGRADEEFVELLNPGDEALDVSSWQFRGAVTFVFKAGTVLPAHGHLFVSPNVTAFRARQSGPGGGKGLYVQGNYRGSLTQAAEGLQLLDDAGRSVAQTNLPGQGPTISAAEIRGGQLWITVPAQPGRSYSIYFTEVIAGEHWTLLQSVPGPEQAGPLQIPVSLQAGSPHGFYRIGWR